MEKYNPEISFFQDGKMKKIVAALRQFLKLSLKVMLKRKRHKRGTLTPFNFHIADVFSVQAP
jgi:hypothetical protein